MAEITLFQKHFRGSEYQTENYYVKLTTDEENENFLFSFDLIACSVTEQMEYGGVRAMITLQDMLGDLVNHRIVEGDFEFFLYFGLNEKESSRFHLKPSHISTSTTNSPHGIMYTVYFVSSNWTEFLDVRHNRAWQQVLYSDIVQEIADELGFENTHITPTKRSVPLAIQPNWTNYKMLQWIQERCTPDTNPAQGAFYFGSTINNGFFFASLGDLIQQQTLPVQGVERTTTRLVMRDVSAQEYTEGFRRIANFNVDQDFMGSSLTGGSGITPARYNYMTKTYEKGEPVLYPESSEPMLSDWSVLPETHVDGSRIKFMHRDPDFKSIARNQVSESNNYTQKVTVEIDGVSDVQLGDVIEIQIPLSEGNSNIPFNEYFSGSYLVTKKKTMSEVRSAKATTAMVLSRQGVNGQDVRGLTQTQTGKSV